MLTQPLMQSFLQPKTRRNFLQLTAGGLAGAFAQGARAVPTGQGDKALRVRVDSPAETVHDVRTFGAKGDGTTIDTPAVNKAIEAAAAHGGGVVRFPAGVYPCFSIHLKSKVTLCLEPGSTILAAESGSAGQYDAAEPNQWAKYQDYGHSHWHNSLIWGEGLEHVAILGPGLIWGKGL